MADEDLDFGWDDAGAFLLGGPLGYGRYKELKGNAAAKKGMQQAQEQLNKLKQEQYARRMADIDKAMSYFGDVDDLMLDMYGGRKKKQQKEIMANPTARRGIGHWGGGPPPPAPPSAPAEAYFAPPPPPQPMPGVRSPMGPEVPASGPYDPLKGRRGGR